MSRFLMAVALSLALTPAGITGAIGHVDDTPDIVVGHRAFALVMEGNQFNGEEWPDTPLLEAYVGERLQFIVHVPAYAEAHTFHVHGHPWHDPSFGRFIDTKLLLPGETHVFNVTAGLEEDHDGDWLYHCHVDSHFDERMFGLLRVYPLRIQVAGELDALRVDLDRLGESITEATFQVTLGGQPLDHHVEALGGGEYELRPSLPPGASGELVVTAVDDELGESVARLALDGQGGYEVVRDVGPVDDLLGRLDQAVPARLPAPRPG